MHCLHAELPQTLIYFKVLSKMMI